MAELLDSHNLDCLMLTETRLDNTVSYELLDIIPSFNFHGLNRTELTSKLCASGGVAMYCRSSMSVTQRSCTLSDDYEIGCFDVRFNHGAPLAHIILVYRSPTDRNVDAFLRDLEITISRLDSKKYTILAGDVNIDFLSNNMARKVLHFNTLLSTQNISLANNDPTRTSHTKGTLIDVICNGTGLCVSSVVTLPMPSDLSDHKLITCTIEQQPDRSVAARRPVTKTYIARRVYSSKNMANFATYLAAADWSGANAEDVNVAWNFFWNNGMEG